MTVTLSDRLDLGAHELIAIVGAGGKTTILHTLGHELADAGYRVVLTTTTRMASDQVTEPVMHTADPALVEASFVAGTPLFVIAGHTGRKADGLTPGQIDRLFAGTSADYVVTEADGARTMSIKAPGDHEPVIPSATTTVIVVLGADAMGRTLATVAHRVDRITAITGLGADDIVTPAAAAQVLLDPEGGLKNIPGSARVIVAITKVDPSHARAAAELREVVADHPRIDRCILLHQPPG